MKSRLLLILIAFLLLGATAPAQVSIDPDSLRWTSPPTLPGVRAAWVIGGEKIPGPYLLRVKLSKGTRIPPHTHSDERSTTVLSGTIFVCFGETFDEARMVPVNAGSVYIAPANVPHSVWARDGDAEYQESGAGPTGTKFIPRRNPDED